MSAHKFELEIDDVYLVGTVDYFFYHNGKGMNDPAQNHELDIDWTSIKFTEVLTDDQTFDLAKFKLGVGMQKLKNKIEDEIYLDGNAEDFPEKEYDIKDDT